MVVKYYETHTNLKTQEAFSIAILLSATSWATRATWEPHVGFCTVGIQMANYKLIT